jgi:hypothetical protein
LDLAEPLPRDGGRPPFQDGGEDFFKGHGITAAFDSFTRENLMVALSMGTVRRSRRIKEVTGGRGHSGLK